jgi:hypothetical protein
MSQKVTLCRNKSVYTRCNSVLFLQLFWCCYLKYVGAWGGVVVKALRY